MMPQDLLFLPGMLSLTHIRQYWRGRYCMELLYSTKITTKFGAKEIAVYAGDIMSYDAPIDILTTSAFVNSYAPTPRTVFKALWDNGISVQDLAQYPALDLRESCHVWLSREVPNPFSHIRRIGCIELIGSYLQRFNEGEIEKTLINSIRAYFSLLDIAAIYNIKMGTIALPLLGSGEQNISSNLLLIPLINECVSFLKRNASVNKICFIEKNPQKANAISFYMQQSYNLLHQQTDAEEQAPTPMRKASLKP